MPKVVLEAKRKKVLNSALIFDRRVSEKLHLSFKRLEVLQNNKWMK